MTDYIHYGFGGEKPKPCTDSSKKLAEAFIEMMDCEVALNEAKRRVPDYTGQWEPEDYYARQQEEWYRAAEQLENTIKTSVNANATD